MCIRDRLNSDKDLDLTNKRFIVFELDNISGNKVLLPVVTLIIMEMCIRDRSSGVLTGFPPYLEKPFHGYRTVLRKGLPRDLSLQTVRWLHRQKLYFLQ